MLSREQEKQVREELVQQIESSFPEDKKAAAKEQVEAMSSGELEKFVKQNSEKSGGGNGCIFCSIVSGDSESFKVAENGSSVAVLEINPVSRGHTIVLPKDHKSYKDAPEVMQFAKQVALILKEKLNPKDVEIASVDFQGHGAINLIPVYSDENIKSERRKASRPELQEVFSALTFQEEQNNPKEKKKKTERKPRVKKLTSKKLWLPKRIP